MQRVRAIIIIAVVFLSIIWVNHHPIMASDFNVDANDCRKAPVANEKLCCLVTTEAVEVASIINSNTLPIINWHSSTVQLLDISSHYTFLNKDTHPPNIILPSLGTIIKRE